jgi:ribulose-5-phosphate 4-epimerase/fuculose-1-phosphate aldolase
MPTGPPTFTDKYEERTYLKKRLAMAFRIFAKFGLYTEGVAGHITLRDPVDPTSFWVNPFGMTAQIGILFADGKLTFEGLHFELIRPEDLILVSHEGKVIDGGKNRFLNYGECSISVERNWY